MEKRDVLETLINYYSKGVKSHFAEKIGLTPQSLHKWLMRDTFDPFRIYEHCENLSADWLLSGEGDMIISSVIRDSSIGNGDNNTNTIHIGEGGSITNNHYHYKGKDGHTIKISSQQDSESMRPFFDVDFSEEFEKLLYDLNTPADAFLVVPGITGADYWCRYRGNAMSPEIKNGDIIALKRCSPSSILFGHIYAVVLNDLYTVKRIRKAKSSDSLRFIPINSEEFDEQEYNKREIIRIYEVIGSVRKFF